MMLEHTKSVRMGVKKSLLVFDLPYNTYRNKFEALKNSRKAINDTKCDAVKIEGGLKVKDIVRYLVKNKIPVLGHIGITPQTAQGKFKSNNWKIYSETYSLNRFEKSKSLRTLWII